MDKWPNMPEALDPGVETRWLTYLRHHVVSGVEQRKAEMPILVNNVLIMLDIIERLSPGLTTSAIADFPGDELLSVEERARAAAALDALPERLRNCWTTQFQLIPDTGRFIGLSCKVCKHWQNAGHQPDCPVADMESVLAVRP